MIFKRGRKRGSESAVDESSEDVGVDELLRVRVARGDFGVRPVSNGIAEAPSSPPRQARKPRTTQSKPAS